MVKFQISITFLLKISHSNRHPCCAEGLSTSGCSLVASDTWWFSTAASGWCTLGQWYFLEGGIGDGDFFFWGVELNDFSVRSWGSCWSWILDQGGPGVSTKNPKKNILPKVPNGKMVIFQEEKTTESGVREFEKDPGMYDRHLYMYIYIHTYVVRYKDTTYECHYVESFFVFYLSETRCDFCFLNTFVILWYIYHE